MRYLFLSFLSAFLFVHASPTLAHCQVPCGIYDDETRFLTLEEHAKTIEKAMSEITRLGTNDPHMVARWAMTKEEHAQKVQDIASAYFLAQRVKAPAADASAEAQADYASHTALLHQIIVAAMTCKQTTDKANVDKLRGLVGEYRAHYFKDHADH